MTSISKQHDLQGRLQVSLAAEGGQQTCSATEQFLAEFEDVPAIAATITPREDAHRKRQTATASKRPKSSEHCVGGDPGPTSQRGGLESGSIGGPYGWSPSSCDRHLRRRRRSRSRSRANITTTNAPKALVDGEMEMALAGGSRLAMKAMRAVQQANTQVCYANLEVIEKSKNATSVCCTLVKSSCIRIESGLTLAAIQLSSAMCGRFNGKVLEWSSRSFLSSMVDPSKDTATACSCACAFLLIGVSLSSSAHPAARQTKIDSAEGYRAWGGTPEIQAARGGHEQKQT